MPTFAVVMPPSESIIIDIQCRLLKISWYPPASSCCPRGRATILGHHVTLWRHGVSCRPPDSLRRPRSEMEALEYYNTIHGYHYALWRYMYMNGIQYRLLRNYTAGPQNIVFVGTVPARFVGRWLYAQRTGMVPTIRKVSLCEVHIFYQIRSMAFFNRSFAFL